LGKQYIEKGAAGMPENEISLRERKRRGGCSWLGNYKK
jgi:hypothetical protein